MEIANGVLSISGEKKSESEDKSRRFSERYYGRFERRISLGDIEEDTNTQGVALALRRRLRNRQVQKTPRSAELDNGMEY